MSLISSRNVWSLGILFVDMCVCLKEQLLIRVVYGWSIGRLGGRVIMRIRMKLECEM